MPRCRGWVLGTAKYLSEEDTKARYITPALTGKGWKAEDMLFEYSLRADRMQIVPGTNEAKSIPPDDSRNRPDYILLHGNNRPIAVIEAKRFGKSAQDGIDQAARYAATLDVPFAFASAGEEFIKATLYPTYSVEHLRLDEFPSPEELWGEWCDARGIPNNGDARRREENSLYYTSTDGRKPRYYQMVAINRTVDAVLSGKRRRVLLVMATGTGKTFVSFQIIWRLLKAKAVRRVLYLADRNQLIDQAIDKTFTPFGNTVRKITRGTIDTGAAVYMGLYQQLKKSNRGIEEEDKAADSTLDVFKQVPRNFFDLVVVDECHRGSAREESSWREILEYFSSAVQIGLTATPNKKDGADNAAYFGDPIYTYTLKQGIEDGFLAPYKVVNIVFDKDKTGWTPREGELDDNGQPIPQRTYTLSDFGTRIEIRNRTHAVAETVTKYLEHIGRMSRTIIFCTTQHHAGVMLEEMRSLNSDMMTANPLWAVRMTANDEEGVKQLKNFTSPKKDYPVVATTSKLLTTGVDATTVKLIVLDAPIRSMTEFKQIIGRGTRLDRTHGKTFFTILDFRGVTALFNDADFDGPVESTDWNPDQADPPASEGDKNKKPHPHLEPPEPKMPPSDDAHQIYEVHDVDIRVDSQQVQYLDGNGKLITEKLIDYTRRNLLQLFDTKDKFLEVWNGAEEKKEIDRVLLENGIFLDELRKNLHMPDADEFDIICYLAYGEKHIFPRSLRAKRVQDGTLLDQYQGAAKKIMEKLLDLYARQGVSQIESVEVLKNPVFSDDGGIVKIFRAFGGRNGYLQSVKRLVRSIYAPN